MSWDVEYTDEFGEWWNGLDLDDQVDIDDAVTALQTLGPGAGRPLVDTIAASRHKNMKELRSGTIRILFAFDPRRTAILLIGGDKRGHWNAWYAEMIPIADRLYDIHVASLRKEGLIE